MSNKGRIINHFRGLWKQETSEEEKSDILNSDPIKQEEHKDNQREGVSKTIEIVESEIMTSKVENIEEQKNQAIENDDEDNVILQLEQVEDYFKAFSSDGQSKDLQEDVAEAKKVLKLHEEQLLITHLNELFDPEHCFNPSLYHPIKTNDRMEFLRLVSKETTILILAVATPEFINKLSPALRVLAGKAREALSGAKKSLKSPSYQEWDDDNKSEVSVCFSEIREELFEDLADLKLNSVPAETGDKGQPTGSNFASISLNLMDEILIIPDESSILLIAYKLITNSLPLKSISSIFLSKTNLMKLIDSLLVLAEIHLTHPSKSNSETLSSSLTVPIDLTPEALVDQIAIILKDLHDLMPSILQLDNHLLIQHRIRELADLQEVKKLRTSAFLLDRFYNLLALLPPNALNALVNFECMLEPFITNLKGIIHFKQKKNSIESLPNLSPAIEYMLLNIEHLITNKKYYDWFTLCLEIPIFSSNAIPVITKLLISNFAALSKKTEKHIPQIKSTELESLIKAASCFMDKEIKRAIYLMELIVINIKKNSKSLSEELLSSIEYLVHNEIITDVIFLIYELLEKLTSNPKISELIQDSTILHLLIVSAYHFYLYSTEKDLKLENDKEKKNSQTDLELPVTNLSKYVSKDPDFGNLDMLPKMTRSFSDVRRNKLIDLNLDTLFSHLTYKCQNEFKKAYNISLQRLNLDYVLRELTRKRHWIISFKDKYSHLW